MGARLIENRAGLARALAAPPMQRALVIKMTRVMVRAVAISPERTGRYRYGKVILTDRNDPGGTRRRAGATHEPAQGGGGFHLVVGVRNGKAFCRLVNTTPYAAFLEFGTRYMRRQRILGRAADALRT